MGRSVNLDNLKAHLGVVQWEDIDALVAVVEAARTLEKAEAAYRQNDADEDAYLQFCAAIGWLRTTLGDLEAADNAKSDEAVRQAWDVVPPGWGGR